jgi:hypothetical protein
MANELYVLSALAKAQVKASQQFGASETRAVTPAVMGLALQNAAISIPAAEQARVHEKRVVDITFFSKKAAGSGTAKSITPTGTKGSSNKVNLVYVTHVESFSVNAKLADNNVYSEQEIFQNEYAQAWQALLQRHNQSAVDYIHANRCQLSAANLATPIATSGAGTWNETNFALEIPVANEKRRLQKAEAFMKARYFDAQFDVIADLATNADLQYLVNQGAGNAQNTAFQFGNSMITPSQVPLNTAYDLGSMIILPKGGFAGICWNDQMNLRNTDKGLAVGMFTTVTDPFGYGCKADLMIKSALVDSSADTVSGSTQDIIDTYEMSLTIAYVLNPLTYTGDAVAHEVAIVA